ncbi:glycosyltransferase family 2 protein [Marinibactrum halimedae]|uniref:Uncharacterized protein n=1 Tax=Marinibactrum halimedae TaxID=1444977 RepID=A0AA37T082_9GAMM|nr:glycosyltransferase family 2 protein [Marinibactrum halimedae]MCD9460684.1 glycosyltransferase family 2 protein [Marinibactrum halimedae]GLS24330.1 hypothetical protein GCM10007877_00410 [Marinibactrum halimedae]
MKLNAICMVKNEQDVIIETLENALLFCDTIYVFDNGSTDGSYEKIQALSKENPKVVIAAHSDEIFKNQLRNRVYNLYNHQYTHDDWWYILDADEMLNESPKPMLKIASQKGKDHMRVWQAQFYFTDKDFENYILEDRSKTITERRRFYKINWREVRFFKNNPDQKWSEGVSGRIPPHCNNLYRPSPICRHYAERTPEQIKQRRNIRIGNPYSFFHVKNKSDNDWLKKSNTLNYFSREKTLTFSFNEVAGYYWSEIRFWCFHKVNGIKKRVLQLIQHTPFSPSC